MIKVILKKGRSESLKRFHPWVFSGAIAQIQGSPAEGDIVAIYSSEGEYLAAGHYQIGSIAVRILSFDADPLAPDFWTVSIARALEVRRAAGLVDNPATNCFRLVHGEGDGLPGLIIDWYDGVCVLQAHSVGMFRAKLQISKALQEVFGDALKAVYDKSSGTAPFKAGLELIDGYLYKREDFNQKETTVLENNNAFIVNWEEGQKTGFFLDQRDNRALVGSHAQGRNVLNLFCYTGGFSVYALNSGALNVDSVDSSARAIDLAKRNKANTGKDNFECFCTDAIEHLSKCEAGKYDLIIVDPPAFAKHRGALKNALRAYQRLNAAAISRVAPGGLVFTFSCSQVVDKISFANTVFSAAAQTGRRVRILDRLCQGADHPVNIYHPEGEYLKGLLLYVE
ncbi:MAG: class I SAM-dependent rRNA methyltransferase [Bacteroidales bacterium]|nr:class I SAM-dependent rRNA methyltransferase [Bacteroidales bacterium]MBQ5582566.1 class I SAM-dependent rRNA methyltransferase [Bacteroidales bacterium]